MLPVWQWRSSNTPEVRERERKQLWEPSNDLKNVRKRLWERTEPRSASRCQICFFFNLLLFSSTFSGFPPVRPFNVGGRAAHCARPTLGRACSCDDVISAGQKQQRALGEVHTSGIAALCSSLFHFLLLPYRFHPSCFSGAALLSSSL